MRDLNGRGRPRPYIMLIFLLLALLVVFPAAAQENTVPDYRIETVVSGADFPVALAYAPDGRLFYTEKNTGQVRVINADGERQRAPVITLPTDGFVERGLLGIAIDPDYRENGHIWVYHTQPNTVQPPYPINRVVRFTEQDGIGSDPVEMWAVPVDTREAHHMGGNLHFDDAGYLYISMGDIGDADYAQDLNAAPGRIHRFAVDGDSLVIPDDNPFRDNSTYAYGLRNPFDFDFDPFSGEIIGGENGPTCDDEINLILAGGNYGWRPDYPCDNNAPQDPARYIYPLISYTPPEAITGVLVYDGAMFPEWEGGVFFCSWASGVLRHATLNESRDRVESVATVDLEGRGCTTDLVLGPAGEIVFTGGNIIHRLTRAE